MDLIKLILKLEQCFLLRLSVQLDSGPHSKKRTKNDDIFMSLPAPELSRCAAVMCERPEPPPATWADFSEAAGCCDRRGVRIQTQIFLELLLLLLLLEREDEEDCSSSCVVYCLTLTRAESSVSTAVSQLMVAWQRTTGGVFSPCGLVFKHRAAATSVTL